MEPGKASGRSDVKSLADTLSAGWVRGDGGGALKGNYGSILLFGRRHLKHFCGNLRGHMKMHADKMSP